MPMDLVHTRGEALRHIQSLVSPYKYLMFETYFDSLPKAEYIVNKLAHMEGMSEQKRSLRTLFLAYMATNSCLGQWDAIQGGEYSRAPVEWLDAETRKVIELFVPTTPTCFAFRQADSLVQLNPIYGMRSGKPLIVPTGGIEHTTGVCLSL